MVDFQVKQTLCAQPLVSIIMPTYNAARYIGEAVESILSQPYQNWELLIIDDASTDDTGDVLEKYSDARIIYECAEKLGSPSKVRNVGLRKAKGEFITFLDSDDAFLPDSLNRMLAPLLEDDSRTAVFGFSKNMDENSQPIMTPMELIPLPEGGYKLPPNYEKTWEGILIGNVTCMLSALMMRRSTLKAVGLLNETLFKGEDYEYYVRIYLENFDGFYCLPDYIYRYRIHTDSLTKTPDNVARIVDDALQVAHWLFDEAKGLPESAQQYREATFAETYRYDARELLIHGQQGLCRKVVMRAFRDSNVGFRAWASSCAPLLVRSFVPSGVNQALVSMRRLVRAKMTEATGESVEALT